MTDNGFNIEVIEVRRHLRRREHIARIEDVQALILHGAEIEVVGRDQHEAVQIVLETPAGFIPVDGPLDAFHRVLGLIGILRLNPDLQQAVLAVRELIDFLTLHQLSGDKREEVAGFERRIFPDGKVPAIIQIALFNEVAVREKDRILLFVSPDFNVEPGQHVRVIREIGDPAEAFRFALGHEVPVGHIDAREQCVGLRMEPVIDSDRGLLADTTDDESLGCNRIAFRGERAAVLKNGGKLEFASVQHQIVV